MIIYTIKEVPQDWPQSKVNQFFIDVFNLVGLKILPATEGLDEFIETYQDALEKGEMEDE